MLSASGGLRPPDPLTRGFAPGPHWGHSPQTPTIGSRSRARHELAPQTFRPNSAYEQKLDTYQYWDLITVYKNYNNFKAAHYICHDYCQKIYKHPTNDDLLQCFGMQNLWNELLYTQKDFTAVSINWAILMSLSDTPPTSCVLRVTWSYNNITIITKTSHAESTINIIQIDGSNTRHFTQNHGLVLYSNRSGFKS